MQPCRQIINNFSFDKKKVLKSWNHYPLSLATSPSTLSSSMAVSLSTLTSTLSSLSFSSHISQRPNTLSFTTTQPFSFSRFPKIPSLVVSATALAEPETADLTKFVKSRLPGGFAAQTIIGTGRRKSASARVVLQEGTGKFIINYRDAKVFFLLFYFQIQTLHFVHFVINSKFEMCSSSRMMSKCITVY